jgi:hypothetical protein
MFVLATIPHGFCPSSFGRTCDIRAPACAKILTQILTKTGVPHASVNSRIARTVVDLNRKRPKRTQKLAYQYWQKFNHRIMHIIQREKEQNILLLDIHSFPKGSFNGAQITIIDIYKKSRIKLHNFILFIREKLKLDVKLYKGLDNHIQNTYKKYTYPLLIEFCEDKTYLSNDSIRLFFNELLLYFSLGDD